MNNVSCHSDVTEILLKSAQNIIQSTKVFESGRVLNLLFWKGIRKTLLKILVKPLIVWSRQILTLEKEIFWNIVRKEAFWKSCGDRRKCWLKRSIITAVNKGENSGADNQHFLLFPQSFLLYPKQSSVFQSHLCCRLQMLEFGTV